VTDAVIGALAVAVAPETDRESVAGVDGVAASPVAETEEEPDSVIGMERESLTETRKRLGERQRNGTDSDTTILCDIGGVRVCVRL
jgi:hypothetical protein